MPTSVAQPRKRTVPGIWALIGAVVAIVAVFNIAVFVVQLLGILALWVVAGVVSQWAAWSLEQRK